MMEAWLAEGKMEVEPHNRGNNGEEPHNGGADGEEPHNGGGDSKELTMEAVIMTLSATMGLLEVKSLTGVPSTRRGAIVSSHSSKCGLQEGRDSDYVDSHGAIPLLVA